MASPPTVSAAPDTSRAERQLAGRFLVGVAYLVLRAQETTRSLVEIGGFWRRQEHAAAGYGYSFG